MTIPIAQLPEDLTLEEAVEKAYSVDIEWIVSKLRVGLSTMVECDKLLAPYLYLAIRHRIQSASHGEMDCQLITGRRAGGDESLMGGMLKEVAEVVRSGRTDGVVVLLHLDLLTTSSQNILNFEARESIAWFYENPQLVILGFKDPNFDIPKVVENVFAVKRSLIGMPRERIPEITLQREARKLGGSEYHPHRLYKYVSGLNAVRFRQIMSHFDDHLDYDPSHPETAEAIYGEIREMTLLSTMEIPKVDLVRDIGGYHEVKAKLEENILTLLRRKETLQDPDEIRKMEELIPRGIIFYGPPGTGKTYFAKAMASAIEATLTVVSGPEIKSKWVGESEENLRRIFAQARRSAPSIIVFDEIDSFAGQRGRFGGGAGVEHSMVNQLLTEMDGFRKEELVFVIGTTNFPESLDPALLRPGRFEFLLEIPYPNGEDRQKIIAIYNQRFSMDMSRETMDYLVRRTGAFIDREKGTRYSGDHIAAVCRDVKRKMLLSGRNKAEISDIDESLGRYDPPRETAVDPRKIAIHECGHVLLAMVVPEARGIEKVSIDTGMDVIAGYTKELQRKHLGGETRSELIADVCVALGGRAAEMLICKDVSMGAWDDLRQATQIVKMMVEELGMSEEVGPRSFYREESEPEERISQEMSARLDKEIESLLKVAEGRAQKLLEKHRPALEDLIEVLLKKKELRTGEIAEILKRHKIPVNTES